MHPQELANRALTLASAAEADGFYGLAAALRELSKAAWSEAITLRRMTCKPDTLVAEASARA